MDHQTIPRSLDHHVSPAVGAYEVLLVTNSAQSYVCELPSPTHSPSSNDELSDSDADNNYVLSTRRRSMRRGDSIFDHHPARNTMRAAPYDRPTLIASPLICAIGNHDGHRTDMCGSSTPPTLKPKQAASTSHKVMAQHAAADSSTRELRQSQSHHSRTKLIRSNPDDRSSGNTTQDLANRMSDSGVSQQQEAQQITDVALTPSAKLCRPLSPSSVDDHLPLNEPSTTAAVDSFARAVIVNHLPQLQRRHFIRRTIENAEDVFRSHISRSDAKIMKAPASNISESSHGCRDFQDTKTRYDRLPHNQELLQPRRFESCPEGQHIDVAPVDGNGDGRQPSHYERDALFSSTKSQSGSLPVVSGGSQGGNNKERDDFPGPAGIPKKTVMPTPRLEVWHCIWHDPDNPDRDPTLDCKTRHMYVSGLR